MGKTNSTYENHSPPSPTAGNGTNDGTDGKNDKHDDMDAIDDEEGFVLVPSLGLHERESSHANDDNGDEDLRVKMEDVSLQPSTSNTTPPTPTSLIIESDTNKDASLPGSLAASIAPADMLNVSEAMKLNIVNDFRARMANVSQQPPTSNSTSPTLLTRLIETGKKGSLPGSSTASTSPFAKFSIVKTADGLKLRCKDCDHLHAYDTNIRAHSGQIHVAVCSICFKEADTLQSDRASPQSRYENHSPPSTSAGNGTNAVSAERRERTERNDDNAAEDLRVKMEDVSLQPSTSNTAPPAPKSLISFIESNTNKDGSLPGRLATLIGGTVDTADGKKLKCLYCDRLYGFETNLRAHIRQRHQGIRVPCPFCSRTFTRNNTVRRHIAREHKHEFALPKHKPPGANLDEMSFYNDVSSPVTSAGVLPFQARMTNVSQQPSTSNSTLPTLLFSLIETGKKGSLPGSSTASTSPFAKFSLVKTADGLKLQCMDCYHLHAYDTNIRANSGQIHAVVCLICSQSTEQTSSRMLQ